MGSAEMNIFQKVWFWLNQLLSKLKFDDIVMNFYDKFIRNMDELFKWIMLILLFIIIVLGIISFIKKTFKLFIVIAVIVAVIFIIYKK